MSLMTAQLAPEAEITRIIHMLAQEGGTAEETMCAFADLLAQLAVQDPNLQAGPFTGDQCPLLLSTDWCGNFDMTLGT